MSKYEMLLKEIQVLRKDYNSANNRIEALQKENKELTAKVAELAEKVESQSTYTAMMTDTLIDVEV